MARRGVSRWVRVATIVTLVWLVELAVPDLSQSGSVFPCPTVSGSTTLSIVIGRATASPCPGQEWAKAYGGTGGDYAYDLEVTPDGGYVVVGETSSFGAGSHDAWALKLDAAGAIQWQRSYGGSAPDAATDVLALPDGGFVVAGRTGSWTAGSDDGWLLRLDGLGNVVWQQTYGGAGGEAFEQVEPSLDGGYVAAGVSGGDFWVVKVDAVGTLQWQRLMGSAAEEKASAVASTPDGGFLVAGDAWTDSGGLFGSGKRDAWVVKLDASGNPLWNRLLGTSAYEGFRSVIALPGGDLVLVGDAGNGGRKVLLVRLDGSGNVLFQKTYGAGIAHSVSAAADGGFIVSGWLDSSQKVGAGGWDVVVLKVDASGALQWERTYGGSGGEWAWAVRQTSDEGYVVGGHTWSFGAGGVDAWVLKLAPNGSIAPSCPAGVGKNVAASARNAGLTANGPTFSFATGSSVVSASFATPVDSTATTSTQCVA